MDTYVLQQDTVSQQTVPLHMCYLHPPLPKTYPWNHSAKESNACFTLERQDAGRDGHAGLCLCSTHSCLHLILFACIRSLPRSWGSCSSLLGTRSCRGWRVKKVLPCLDTGSKSTGSKADRGEKHRGSWGATGNCLYRYRAGEKSRGFLLFCWSTVLTIRKEQVGWRDSPPSPGSLTGPKGPVQML